MGKARPPFAPAREEKTKSHDEHHAQKDLTARLMPAAKPLKSFAMKTCPRVGTYTRVARIRSRISFAAAGMLVPGPKIAFTPAAFRKS